jgi:hypothetical protein
MAIQIGQGASMHSDRNLRLLLGAGTLAVVSSLLGVLAWVHKPLPPDGDPVLGSPQLVMFETDKCGWCENFRRKAAREYLSTEASSRAPLKYMSVDDGPPPKRYRLDSFSRSPMLVLFDQYGRELARLVKEPANGEALESMVRRNLRNVKG